MYPNNNSHSQADLFTSNAATLPLAAEARPQTLADFLGQEALIKILSSLNLSELPHLIFWGPPGTGKTTICHILANLSKHKLYTFNAVLAGIPELRKLIQEALDYQSQQQKKAIIFIDEIHRFSKSQQDALLPYLESGSFILLGATTEYPQTSLNRAILSRVRCLELKALTQKNIADILNSALAAKELAASTELIQLITEYANGDARVALGHLEMLINLKTDLTKPDLTTIKEQLLQNARLFDKDSDRHYDVISAFIKSIRGSDTDASLLWLAVMIDGGEDPVFIARRLMIAASEDVGNADPRALQLATNAHYAVSQIGMPEARIILAQATTYLAQAPKSNASYLAIDQALAYVQNNPTIQVPTHLRNHHPDKKNYLYPHSYSHHWTKQTYAPVPTQTFYHSSDIGMEKVLADYQKKIRTSASSDS